MHLVFDAKTFFGKLRLHELFSKLTHDTLCSAAPVTLQLLLGVRRRLPGHIRSPLFSEGRLPSRPMRYAKREGARHGPRHRDGLTLSDKTKDIGPGQIPENYAAYMSINCKRVACKRSDTTPSKRYMSAKPNDGSSLQARSSWAPSKATAHTGSSALWPGNAAFRSTALMTTAVRRQRLESELGESS
jgi:hypothetical protein